MNTEQQVATHYTHGSLLQAILDALKQMGKDPVRFTAMDLSTGDEFHLGWLPATAALAEDLRLAPGMHVLDVGCGIGGPARYFAEAHKCRVTGIDLTEEFAQVAAELTRRCGLIDLVTFRHGSALDLPFYDGSFDAATLIHVGMNIADKARLYAGFHRVFLLHAVVLLARARKSRMLDHALVAMYGGERPRPKRATIAPPASM